MKVNRMKRENDLLKWTNESLQQRTWRGFRNDADAPISEWGESEAPLTPSDEGSQVSTYSRNLPSNPTDLPFDGVIHELERCQIASRSGSPVDDRGQEPGQNSVLCLEPSTMSSAGSTSSRESVSGSVLANLQGNRVDLIFEADRQRMSELSNSKTPTSWEDDL